MGIRTGNGNGGPGGPGGGRGGATAQLKWVSTPAIVAVMNVATDPPSTARSPKRAMVSAMRSPSRLALIRGDSARDKLFRVEP